jgi:hypothetical protein
MLVLTRKLEQPSPRLLTAAEREAELRAEGSRRFVCVAYEPPTGVPRLEDVLDPRD